MSTKKSSPLTNNIFVVLAIGLVLGFSVGFLYAKVQYLEGGGSKKADAGNDQAAEQVLGEQNAPSNVDITAPDPDEDHWKGSKDANIVLVEYSDFECPFCGNFYDTVKQVEAEYGDEVALVYRHFPLSFHPKADPAAQATECVADVAGPDAFWTMHDKIFEAMPAMAIDQLVDLAVESGADRGAYETCMDEERYAQKVSDHLSEGSSAGVAATPTTVVYNMETGDTEVIEGALPFEAVQQAIEGML